MSNPRIPAPALGQVLVVLLGAGALGVATAVTECGARTLIRLSPGPLPVPSARKMKERTASHQQWRTRGTTGMWPLVFANHLSTNVPVARSRTLWVSALRSRARKAWRSRQTEPARRRTTNALRVRCDRPTANVCPAMGSAPREKSVGPMEPARRMPIMTATLIPSTKSRLVAAMIAALRLRAAGRRSCAGRREFSGVSTATPGRTAT